MPGILRPAGAHRRVTTNAGNSGFIKGGFHIKTLLQVDVPVFIGPEIPTQAAQLGVPFSLACAPLFDGPAGSTYIAEWQPPVTWLSMDPTTGVLSGTPTASGFVDPVRVGMVHNALGAPSNEFRINISP
jgi:hypothetical protein